MRIVGQDTVNTISKPQTGDVLELSKTATGGGPAGQNTTVSADGVDLGSQNDLVAQTQTAGSGDRSSRIEQLRALVQSGQYEVDAATLSQSIVSAALNGC